MMQNFSDDSKSECIFWGKFHRDGQSVSCLSLVAHCIDVAIVFRTLVTLPGIRRAFHHAAGRTLTDVDLDRLAVLSYFHDLGKSNLGFQFKVFDPGAAKAGHIQELIAIIGDEHLSARLSNALDIETLLGWSPPECPEALESLLLASWSHHGRPVNPAGEMGGRSYLARHQWWRAKDGWDPFDSVRQLRDTATIVFPNAFGPGGQPLPISPRFQHVFAGLVMLSDWLGSHPQYFPIQQTGKAERLAKDKEIIPRMLKIIGLEVHNHRQTIVQAPITFKDRFGFDPRPLQAALHTLDPQDPATRLIIAESETGSGKTEAALDWFCTLFSTGKVDGLYFALPTRVAARELYIRVSETINRWFPDPGCRPVTVLAIPGYPQIDGLTPEQILPIGHDANRWEDENSETVSQRERMWAIEHPKRFLAATVAVGTVDQALLSAVQTAHAHLRSICLARSLLVVDEVHASDLYMSAILRHLIDHHLKLGGYSLLLSATLGSHARTAFLDTAGPIGARPDFQSAVETPYPSLTLADGLTRGCGSATSVGKVVVFEILPVDSDAVLEALSFALRAGARVLVILNTVARAIGLLRRTEEDLDAEWFFRCAGMVCPHHGRFAPEDRLLLDKMVSQRMGKESSPGPLLLIGTQTLEQSLDIDGDLIITDLCPADVLLQRVGRLHRHDRGRPPGFEVARCIVLAPAVATLAEAINARGQIVSNYKKLGYGSVYSDLRSLELTLKQLTRMKGEAVQIPRDNRLMVEGITHPDRLDSLNSSEWVAYGQSAEGRDLAQALSARAVLMPYEQAFGDFSFCDSGAKVATRLGTNRFHIPLSEAVRTPFGQTITAMLVPDHMAPESPEEVMKVHEAKGDNEIQLSLKDTRSGRTAQYRYSRFGLEKEEEK